jgi:hypothetical protein
VPAVMPRKNEAKPPPFELVAAAGPPEDSALVCLVRTRVADARLDDDAVG